MRLGLGAVLVLLLLVAAVTGVHWYGARRWAAGSRGLRARLTAARCAIRPERVDLAELAGLPAPVQRYFRQVLSPGQPMLAAARIEHRGDFNLAVGGERWRPFRSVQHLVTRRPGFVWDARVALLPGVDVRVNDAYLAGEGVLQAAQLAEGELFRFLAEALWYPTALLPSQGILWEAVDERSAKATLADGAVLVSLVFSFDDRGLIDRVHAEGRGYAAKGQVLPMPWECRLWDYQTQDGMLIPMAGEVAWRLPQGLAPYWRGRITRIDYEYAGPDRAVACRLGEEDQ